MPEFHNLLERIRDVKYEYVEIINRYEDMKLRGNLTEDWGECSLICARETLRWIIYIETGRKSEI